jgi:hypothetical protein
MYSSDRHADFGSLGYRRHTHAVVPVGRDERMILGRRQVLAEVQNARIALHLLVDARVDRRDEGKIGHDSDPCAYAYT